MRTFDVTVTGLGYGGKVQHLRRSVYTEDHKAALSKGYEIARGTGRFDRIYRASVVERFEEVTA